MLVAKKYAEVRILKRDLSMRRLKPFRNSDALRILIDLAESLRISGYHPTVPKPGKACDGLFRCEIPNFSVGTTLVAALEPSPEPILECQLCVRVVPSLFQGDQKETDLSRLQHACDTLCSVIDRELKRFPDVALVRWMSKPEC